MSLKALCISQNTLSALTYSTHQLPSLWLHPPHVPGFGASPLLADCVYSGFLSPNPPKDTVLAVGFVPPCVAVRGWGAVLPLPMPCCPIWHLFPGPAGRRAGPGPRQMFPPAPATSAPSWLSSCFSESLHSTNSAPPPAPRSVTHAKPSILIDGFWVCSALVLPEPPSSSCATSTAHL